MKTATCWVSTAAVLSFIVAPSLAHAQGFRTGVLPLRWDHGGPDCTVVQSDFQIWKYNDDLYILRESGCVHEEKPFLYLLFGQDKVILFDTGAGPDSETGGVHTGRVPNVVGTVDFVINEWLKRNNRTSIHLVVTHLHSHLDHIWGDFQFVGRPDTTLVPPKSVPALQSFFGIQNWPTQIVQYDLGGRVLDIIPIPGHEVTHIAVYDRQTALLLTGDMMYPGRIYINEPNPDIIQASAQRLVDFTATRKVAHVLGTHIEQRGPYLDYPVGTRFAPDEQGLELGRDVLLEELEAMKLRTRQGSGGLIPQIAYRDFSTCGPYPTCNKINIP
jgi:hydroxyacylglutathione hydrolase